MDSSLKCLLPAMLSTNILSKGKERNIGIHLHATKKLPLSNKHGGLLVKICLKSQQISVYKMEKYTAMSINSDKTCDAAMASTPPCALAAPMLTYMLICLQAPPCESPTLLCTLEEARGSHLCIKTIVQMVKRHLRSQDSSYSMWTHHEAVFLTCPSPFHIKRRCSLHGYSWQEWFFIHQLYMKKRHLPRKMGGGEKDMSVFVQLFEKKWLLFRKSTTQPGI